MAAATYVPGGSHLQYLGETEGKESARGHQSQESGKTFFVGPGNVAWETKKWQAKTV